MKYREILEACWTGYQQQGMKQKGDRQVPNCVPVAEVKTGPEITSKELLFKAAAQAMLAAGQEGQALDYEQAIKQASKIYGIPYTPSELPRLLAQRAEIDRQLALLKQGKKVAKARRQAKLAPTPAGAEEYWKSHSLPTDRIKPPAKTLEEQLEENLRKWFKEKWVRFGPDGKIRGDCARGSESEGKPKCLPQSKAHALGKKKRASAAAKKRREDPNPERRGPAKNVATRVREDELNEISDQLLARYKQKAGQQASELDRQAFGGNDPQAQQKIAKANKRFSGIVRATNKQFDTNGSNINRAGHNVIRNASNWQEKMRVMQELQKNQELMNDPGSRAAIEQRIGDLVRIGQKHGYDKSTVKESLRPGEYHVATVTLDNGEVRKFKVTFDEGYTDAIKNFYARQGRTVKNIDMDWSVQGDFYEDEKDKSGSPMYRREEVYMVVHNGKEVAFYKPANMKQAYQDAEELVNRFGGEAHVRKVIREDGVAETVTDVKAGMAEIYHRLAPKIKRYRDSFLAGQLYDELENYAELHGAEREFKRMMSTARNSAHMEYDTNPGGFENWFWFLPFEKQLDEKQDACYHKVKSRYKVWPSAYASGALVQCRKKGAANWGTGGKKK